MTAPPRGIKKGREHIITKQGGEGNISTGCYTTANGVKLNVAVVQD
jgi:hypothetical protein